MVTQDMDDWSARVDFLATYMAEQIDGGLLAKELESLLGCQVGLSKNLEGSDIQVTLPPHSCQLAKAKFLDCMLLAPRS